ncbi:MAG: lipA [Chlamydiales bacterium]|nr:lipA [Chlamydiales bacterium]
MEQNPSDRFNAAPRLPKRLNVLPPNPEALKEPSATHPGRFPSWLHRSLPKGAALVKTSDLLSQNRLHTVCEEAKCPNLLECYSKQTATFLVMGRECTRSCGFCDIAYSKKPKELDPGEPDRVAASALALNLKHVVVTMVARDDLADGGAAHLAAILGALKRTLPASTLEVLTSDFSGRLPSIDTVLEAGPQIFNHNIETVARLSPSVRHQATYERSLSILSYVKGKGRALVKSGLMVGLGETESEVFAALDDLKRIGVDIVTIGQYLQPNFKKLAVKAFIPPDAFAKYEKYGQSIGLKYIYAGPFIRSSYNAGVVFEQSQHTLLIESL